MDGLSTPVGFLIFIASTGGAPLPSLPPAEFGTFIVSETAKWAKVIKFAGLKPQ